MYTYMIKQRQKIFAKSSSEATSETLASDSEAVDTATANADTGYMAGKRRTRKPKAT
jgi:hypothetical protein